MDSGAFAAEERPGPRTNTEKNVCAGGTQGSPVVLTVIALGGNALTRPGERGTAAEQRANLAITFRAIAPLLRDGPFVITHGNGPQVGNELLRQELASAEAPPLPLYVAVAQTQAEIGALVAAELEPTAGRSVAVVMTRVEVDPEDPAFQSPTKPVGPFYDSQRAELLREERGWAVKEDAGRGWRRVVPSPHPLRVLELEAIRTLLENDVAVVAVGGGGVPVVSANGRHDGIDAVIDKDHASALLAIGLGAERLVILTQVPAVYEGFGSDEQRAVPTLTPGADDDIVARLPAGSMRPKVEAAFRFVRETGGEALITSADALEQGGHGTRVLPA
jgi:carbamate kinase